MPEKVRRSKKLGENAAGTLAYDFCADLKKKNQGHQPGNCEIFLGTFAVLQKQKQKKRLPAESRTFSASFVLVYHYLVFITSQEKLRGAVTPLILNDFWWEIKMAYFRKTKTP